MDKIVYEAQPELEIETSYKCGINGCSSICFDEIFAEDMGCAIHGLTMVRVVRQFENGKMISEFKERLDQDGRS